MKEFAPFLMNGLQYEGYTYHAALAKENQFQILERLYRTGQVDFGQVLYGYAVQGDKSAIDRWLERAGDQYLPDIVRGLARGNHKDILAAFCSEAEQIEHQIGGYAQAGLSDSWRLAGLYSGHFKYGVMGFAQGGQAEYVKKVISGSNLYADVIFHAACQGQSLVVNGLIDQARVQKNEREIKEILDQAVRGYCHGMHYHHVSDVVQQGSSVAVACQTLPSSLYYAAMLVVCSENLYASFNEEFQLRLHISQQSLPAELSQWREAYQSCTPGLPLVDFASGFKDAQPPFYSLMLLDPDYTPPVAMQAVSKKI